ncbi:hypothetical protein DLM76_18590 [Leptospira yasudae]|uniref:Gfo/Idh/MocA family protein n=1 Tax=Leptospira yasudae TaxID=2202201 RepID=UPI000E5A053A|nr:Gfo/Idh/MocA family oxidoreductase [Leptospira yasudae]RHX91171.1 hypothetical protein DLM76_18590 [Leptospira yasudae]
MKFRSFLIGLGQIGMGYDYDKDPDDFQITHLTALLHHPDFELVGAYDPIESARVKFQQKTNLKADVDLRQGLIRTNPDFIIIATPTKTHYEIVEVILKNVQPSFLLCEKPIAYTVEEAKKIKELCIRKNVRLFVNYQRRYFPSSKEIKLRLEKVNSSSGFIKGVCWYSKGLIHNGTHFLNLLQYWLGSIKNTSVIRKNRFWENSDPESDVLFSFEKGDVFFLSSREEDYSHYSIELVTSEGKLSYLRGGEEAFWQSKIFDPIYPKYTILNDKKEYFSNDSSYSQRYVLQELTKAMQGKEAEFCDAESSIQMTKILNQITDSPI